MADSKSHGMVLEIRALRESEDFDLANYDTTQVTALMQAAFTEPIDMPAGKMLRCSFLVGGGKKVRQKYSESLSKDIANALSAIGFEDDRGASCVLECQGSFKYQHDTDKDLIKMHVFPRVKALPEAAAEEAVGGDMPGDCARLIVSSPLWSFKELVTTNAPSFIQHKALHKVMKGVAGRFEEMDAKLVAMQSLDADETELFERGADIGDKVSWLEVAMEAMIAAGQLTAGEQVFMVADFHAKVQQVEAAVAAQQAKGKKTEKLEQQLDLITAKRDTVSALTPLPRKKGADAKDIEQLRNKLKALCKIENKSGLMSGSEATELAKKPQIEERLAKLEAGDSSGWFDSKVKEMEALVRPKPKPKAASKPAAAVAPRQPASMYQSGGGINWGSVGGGARRPAAAAGGIKKLSNPYAALMGDDDDDDSG